MDAPQARCAFFRIARAAMRGAALCLFAVIVPAQAEDRGRAAWFPDPPAVKRFAWAGDACEGCKPLAPRAEWLAMAALAGTGTIRFMRAADENGGQAWSAAPDIVVLSSSALKLPDCQLAFLVGHELVHIAQRHFDEDALELLVLSGKPHGWTRTGETAMALLDGNFSLALRLSSSWQQQEWEADWVGSLLAAQGCGCRLDQGALPYFDEDGEFGGGLAAAHDSNAMRMRMLKPFEDSARRLADRMD